jgi:ferredoxin-type protein NapG
MGDQEGHDPRLARREFVGLAARGAAVVALGGAIRLHEPDEKFLRPPGAVPEVEFLALCTRCGICQEICPRAIFPVLLTESVISAGTPRLYFNCARCMRCNYFCPTGALAQRR